MSISIVECIRLACLLEVTARKPGNISPVASWPGLTITDFAISANAVARPLSSSAEIGVGHAILESVRATQAAVGRNTNLGIILLLAPLAAVPRHRPLANGIEDILSELTVEDAALTYEAIRLAKPGGMGRVREDDLSLAPTRTLRQAMALAADRDSVASEYVSGFAITFGFCVPLLRETQNFARCWEETIIRLHLSLMADYPDTLIARKCGRNIALKSAELAQQVLDAGWPDTSTGQNQMMRLDAWLRADGNRRNPGTTADLIAACLFAVFRDSLIPDLDVDALRRIVPAGKFNDPITSP